jgi:CHASE2 domain-containing sensor protein
MAVTSTGAGRGRFPAYSLLVCIFAALATSALLYAPLRSKLERIEYWTADWRTVLLADRTPDKHPRVVLALFDPDTFDGAIVSPIPRDKHAQVLWTLAAMEPAAIALDFYFVSSQGEANDKAMLEALHKIERPIVLGGVDHHTTEFNARQLAYQKQFLASAGRPVGYLHLDYGPGQVVRRTEAPLPDSPFQESFARQIALAAGAKLTGPGTSSASMPVAWLKGPGNDTEPFLRVNPKDLLPDADAARREEIAQRVKGNIVMTGIAMRNSDEHNTALSVWTDRKMFGAVIHAHILAQLLDNRYFYELEGRSELILLVAVGLGGALLGWALRDSHARLLNLGVATAVLVGVDAICYMSLRLVLPFTLMLCVWFIGALAGRHLRKVVLWFGRASARPRRPPEGLTKAHR